MRPRQAATCRPASACSNKACVIGVRDVATRVSVAYITKPIDGASLENLLLNGPRVPRSPGDAAGLHAFGARSFLRLGDRPGPADSARLHGTSPAPLGRRRRRRRALANITATSMKTPAKGRMVRTAIAF